MPVTIGTNIASLRTQRELGKTTAALSRVFERLSSGQRINHASDDAAGLAIASQLNASARVFSQAIRNVNDGASVLNIAEGATQELTSILQRQKELATQSANGTYGTAQRTALQKEANELTGEFNRIIATTAFNGSTLLDGRASQLTLQVGRDSSSAAQISVDLSGLLGTGSSTSTTTASSGSAESDTFDLSGTGVTGNFYFLNEAAGSDIFDGMYFQFSLPSGTGGQEDFYVWMDVTGFAVDPLLTGTGIKVRINSSDDAGQVTNKIADALNGNNYLNNNFGTAVASGDNHTGTLTVTAIIAGSQVNIDTLGGIGTDPRLEPGYLVQPEENFYFSTPTHNYIVYYDNILGAATNPDGSKTGIKVDITDDESAATILAKTVAAIQAAASDVTVSTNGLSLTVTANATGAVASPGQNQGSYNSVNFTPTQATAGTNSTINAATDRLTIQSHGYTTGQAITLATSGTLPGGLSSASTYYAIIVDANTIKLATSASNAASGTAVNITNTGVGVMTLSTSAVGGSANASAYISNLDLGSQTSSRSALDIIDSQMTMVSKTIGSIGASQSRLASALNTLDVARENSLAAASRILSVDIASESAELARREILQQAGAAVLAQANQLPSLALQLLR